MNAPRRPMFSANRPLSDAERKSVTKELAEIEKELVRRRAKLAEWDNRIERGKSDPSISVSLLEEALEWRRKAQELVQSGERLRAMYLSELRHQPVFQSEEELVH